MLAVVTTATGTQRMWDYNALLSYARRTIERNGIDRNWTLGDLAVILQDQSGSKALPGFAREIGVPLGELKRYRLVSLAYPDHTAYRYGNGWSIYRVLAHQTDRFRLVLQKMTRAEAIELVQSRKLPAGPPLTPDQQAIVAAIADDWTPHPLNKTRAGVARRRAIVADMAARGCTVRQMAERLGIKEEHIRRIAQRYGIELRANKALHGHHGPRDANHMLASITDDLLAITPSFDMLDRADLDPAKLRDWLTVLRDSARDIAALARRLEGKGQ